MCPKEASIFLEISKRDERVPRGAAGTRPRERLPEETLLGALQMTTLSREEWWGLLSIKPPRREIQRESLEERASTVTAHPQSCRPGRRRRRRGLEARQARQDVRRGRVGPGRPGPPRGPYLGPRVRRPQPVRLRRVPVPGRLRGGPPRLRREPRARVGRDRLAAPPGGLRPRGEHRAPLRRHRLLHFHRADARGVRQGLSCFRFPASGTRCLSQMAHWTHSRW